ncbi:MAG: hypothetical protein RI101_12975 [Nitrospira sp.]|jgi:hypothetical protein|nr:hypothetical protein [Nitrospira sp.]
MEMNQDSSNSNDNAFPMVKAKHAITNAVNTLVLALDLLPETEMQTRNTVLEALAVLGVSEEDLKEWSEFGIVVPHVGNKH